jgi:hypothetical protein
MHSSDATSTHRRTFSARPRVGMCRQCPHPRADECSAFGPSASDDAFDVGFSVLHQRTLVSQHEGTRATRLHIARRSVTCTIARTLLEDICDKPIVIQSYCAVVRLHGLRATETDDLLREIE